MFEEFKKFGIILAVPCALAIASVPVAAQEVGDPVFSTQTASVTYGPYFRFELGGASNSYDNGNWRSPGYDPDPQVNFNITDMDSTFGTIAFGHDYQNGFRAEAALSVLGQTDISGPCSSTSNLSSCNTHADITNGSLQTSALMANVYYAPFEAAGNNSVFQPFITAGVGIARNHMGDWTRTANPGNTTAAHHIRTFAGDTTYDLAWSVGLGASWQVTGAGNWPILLEASWRYFDFGTASGGVESVGPGSSSATRGLRFDNTTNVISLGLRFPLQRL